MERLPSRPDFVATRPERRLSSAVSKAVELGWLERTSRNGGARGKSQTNQYDLTLPLSIQRVLSNTGPELAVTQIEGEWQVVQVTDGVAISGPFKSKASAKRWLAEHGPTGQMKGERPDKLGVATGQIRGGDRTNGGGRGDIRTPQNLEADNREVIRTGKIQNTSTEVEPRKRGTAKDSAGDWKPSVPVDDELLFDGTNIKLRAQEFNRWANAFSHLNLLAELHALDEYAGECVAKGKSWQGPVSAALARRHREVKADRERMLAEVAAKF